MSIGLLQYGLSIIKLIRQAEKQGTVSRDEVECLNEMVAQSVAASATEALIYAGGAPDSLYAALYFSTGIWQSGEADECDAEAEAGYKLAMFVMDAESPEHDPYWAEKLLRGLYDAHQKNE
jgi:hypothetical protein